MLIFEVLDKDDWPIEELLFNEVYQGRESEIKIFRVVNTREEDIYKITIRAIKSPTHQVGNVNDTVMAHLFSLNGLDFQREINFPLPGLEEKLIYTYYRPPSITDPGDVEWAMELFSTPDPGVEDLCD